MKPAAQPLSLMPDAIKYLLTNRPSTSLRKIARKVAPLFQDKFTHIFIDTITACNRRCAYCPNSVFERGLLKNKKLMDAGLYRKIIDDLAAMGFRGEIAPNFYGEPLLDERLADLIAYAKSRLPRSTVVIFTNGDLLTVDIYKKLAAAGADEFVITQHSQEQSRGVLEVLAYRRAHGAGAVSVSYGKLNKVSNRGGLVQLRKKAVAPKKCDLPKWKIGVDLEGNVLICCHDYHSSVKLGDLKKERLIDVWNKPQYKLLRQEIGRGIYKLDICKKCAVEAA